MLDPVDDVTLEVGSYGMVDADGVLDLRIALPPSEDDIAIFVSAEMVIAAGDEVQFCTYVESPSEDLYIEVVEMLQGKYGHHAILLATRESEPAGTVIDCTSEEAMGELDLLLLPLELPPGHAQRLPANSRMVVQSHYFNVDSMDVRVRDVVRLHTVPIEAVEVPTAPFATHNYDVAVEPGASRELSFDCTMDRDAGLITIGGHMHELGTAFNFEHASNGAAMQAVYTLPKWQEDYRDAPPIESFVNNPLPLSNGDTLRTTCTWNNTRDHVLEWPEEMCSAFGLLTGSFEPYICDIGIREE